ncbi:MAG: RsmE family RNA methyltransferase [Phycisphaerae bacterium]|nr:RsmE family RNA methyltransferase [Phycisphaerae bacterium]
MRTARFFCDSLSKNTCATLTDAQFRHLTKVLRLKIGDSVELFDGKGALAQAVIEKIEKSQTVLTVKTIENFPKPSQRRVIIASSIAKGDRFELLVAKCTELGADRIVPVIFERTVKQAIQQRRLENIALESTKQCQRLFLPQIDLPTALPQAIENLKSDYPSAKIIFGSLTNVAESVINFDFGKNDIIAFVGPEGGMTQIEENTLKKTNALPVKLTDTVLRIETAAIAFAAILTSARNK